MASPGWADTYWSATLRQYADITYDVSPVILIFASRILPLRHWHWGPPMADTEPDYWYVIDIDDFSWELIIYDTRDGWYCFDDMLYYRFDTRRLRDGWCLAAFITSIDTPQIDYWYFRQLRWDADYSFLFEFSLAPYAADAIRVRLRHISDVSLSSPDAILRWEVFIATLPLITPDAYHESAAVA